MASPPVLFISDLHLTPTRPVQVALFEHFARTIAPLGSALYVLGDLFEFWVGDDDLENPFNAKIAAEFKALGARGVALYFMPGNRDFLAGHSLADASNWHMLADPTPIDLFGACTLLSHGDLFCTEDLAYQTFRKEARSPAWQAEFLSRPRAARYAIAQTIREKSEQAKSGKQVEVMDVTPAAVHEAMRLAHARRLIHGHTHRPAHHTLQIDGQSCERWVLPDWYETGGYLSCDETGCKALGVTLDKPQRV